MEETSLQRFKNWLCKTFGHKTELSRTWYYQNAVHCNCDRCNRVVTNKFTGSK